LHNFERKAFDVKYVNPWDFILVPMFIGLIYSIAKRKQANEIEDNDAYRYYVRAIMYKIFGGITLAAVYAFYYGGGDTINYWSDAGILSNLMLREPACYLDILFGDTGVENYFCFDNDTGRPEYYLKDKQSFTIPRVVSLFYLITFKAFFGCTILVAWVAFGGVWKMYLVFCEEYPRLKREFAISILFVPSVLFWGSGILKDTFTFTAACWMTYSIYNIFIKQRDLKWNILYLIISSWIIISIKPYIFVALLPGGFLWAFSNRIKEIGNPMLKVLAAPLILMVGVIGVSFFFAQAASSLGDYGSVDTMLKKAVVTQDDLKSAYYGGNTFDIGAFEPTIPGILSKAPIAIFSGMFRPTLLDTRNFVMLLSAVENTVVMLFFLYVLITIGPIRYISGIFAEPMAMFGFVFALFFSFAVGLTTANFGSLVRYKIPAIPFFLISLYIARDRKLRLEEELDETDTAFFDVQEEDDSRKANH
jgi:hypothetical protein